MTSPLLVDTAFALVVAALLYEAFSLLVRGGKPRYVRELGALSLLLVLLGGIVAWGATTGRLVIGPEYGVLLASGGPLTRISVWLLLIGIAVVGGELWRVVRAEAGLSERRPWRRELSVIIGILAGLELRALNPSEPELFRVHAYDLWSPPLLAWLCICLMEAGSTLLRLPPRVGALASALTLLAVGLFGRSNRPAFASDNTRLLGAIGLWLAFGAALVLLLSFAVALLVRVLRGRSPPRREPPASRPQPRRRLASVLPVALMLLILAVTFGFIALDTELALTLLLLAWLLLVEMLSGGPLRALGRRIVQLMGDAAHRLEQQRQTHRIAWMGAAWARGFTHFKRVVSVQSVPAAIVKILLAIVLLIALAEVPNVGKTIIQPFGVHTLEKHDELGEGISEQLLGALHDIRRGLQPDILMLRIKDVDRQPSQRQQRPEFVPSASAAEPGVAYAQRWDLELGGIKIPYQVVVAPLLRPLRGLLGIRVIHGSLHEDQSSYSLIASSTKGGLWQVRVFKTELESGLAGSSLPADSVSLLARKLAFEMVVSADPRFVESTGLTRAWEAFDAFQEGLGHWTAFERSKDFEELKKAVTSFEKAVTRDPNFALAHLRLGHALIIDRQEQRATAAFRKSVKSNPRFVAGMISLANLLQREREEAARQEFPVNLLHREREEAARQFFDYLLQREREEAARQEFPDNLLQRERGEAAGQESPLLWHQVIERQRQRKEAARQESRLLWRQVFQMEDEASSLELAQAWLGLCSLDLPSGEETPHEAPDALLIPDKIQLAYFQCKRTVNLYERLPEHLRELPQYQLEHAAALTLLGIILEGTYGRAKSFVVRFQRKATQDDWFCRPLDESREEGLTIQHWDSPSFFRRRALNFYERALNLSPEDPVLRCNYATTAWFLEDRSPMAELSESAEAHLELARNSAEGNHFHLAFDEYEQTIVRTPLNVDALNEYAYTFWEWRNRGDERVVSESELQRKGPSDMETRTAEKYGETAEKHVRQAIDLARGSLSRSEEAMVRSTLGEVLLGLARPDEAIRELHRALELAQDHPIFDEIRWDLVRAKLCAADNAAQLGVHAAQVTGLKQQAFDLLDELYRNSLQREDPFVPTGSLVPGDTSSLEPKRTWGPCSREKGRFSTVDPTPDEVRFALREDRPRYEHGGSCNWMGVRARVPTRDPLEPTRFELHIWGCGVNLRIPAEQGPARGPPRPEAILSYQPADTINCYLAQLEDDKGKRLSRTYAIPTYANEKSGGCPQNVVILDFENVQR